MLSRLTLLIGRPCKAVESGLALALHQQQQGLFAAAHAQLLEVLFTVKRTNKGNWAPHGVANCSFAPRNFQRPELQPYASLLHRLTLLHSYLMVPRLLEQGDQHKAALLLIRVSSFIEE